MARARGVSFRWLLVLVLGLATACTFDTRLPEAALIRCSADNGSCPPGLVCQLTLGRCVSAAPSDRVAPTIVSATLPTTPLKRGALAWLELSVSEPLGVPPVAVMTQPTGASRFDLVASDGGLSFRFERAIGGDDTHGFGNVSVDLVDVDGNAAPGQVVGALTLDFIPPSVQRVTFVSPRPAVSGALDVVPSDVVSARVTMTEPVLDPQLVVQTSAGCAAGPQFSLVANANGLLDWSAAGPPGQSGCTYQLGLRGLVDLAGNAATPVDVPLNASYRVDGDAPSITSLDAVRPTDGGWVPALVFSRAPGFDTVGLRFTLDGTAASFVASFDGAPLAQCGAAQCTAAAGGARDCLCVRSVTAADLEAVHSLSVSATDPAGNTRAVSAPVRFDFTAPRVIARTEQVLLTPAPGARVATVAALTTGATLSVLFSIDEPGTATVSTTPTALTVVSQPQSATSFLFTATLPTGAAAQGAHQLFAATADEVGNQAQQALTSSFAVDTTAPGAPAVLGDGGVLYTRVPWGLADAGLSFTVTGTAGSVEAGALVVVTDERGSEAGRARAAASGSFAVELSQSDRPVVLLTAVDAAGNASATVDVKHVEWIASLVGKVRGSAAENPHEVEQRPRFVRSLRWTGGTEAALPAVASGLPSWAGPVNLPPGETSAAFDEARGKVVVFAGALPGWTHRLFEWDGARWIERTPVVGPQPEARGGHAMAFDSWRGKVISFGGFLDNGGESNDVWEWDGVVWVSRGMTAVAPPSRKYHAMAFDSRRGRLVVFGGEHLSAGDARDLWEWDGRDWFDLTPTDGGGPSARSSHRLAFDPERGKTVLFGGSASGAASRETWEWDGVSWVDRTPSTGGPGARAGHALAYDPARRRVVLFGGVSDGSNTNYFGDLWEWDGVAWVLRSAAGAPGGLGYPASAFDTRRNQWVIVDGFNAQGWQPRTWELGDAGWRERTPSVEPSLSPLDPSMTYDPVRRRTVIFGGRDPSGGADLATLWEWDGVSLREVTPAAGPQPTPRYWSGMVFDAARSRTLVLGGSDGTGARSDLWEWDGVRWSSRSAVGAAPAGSLQAAVYDSNRGRTAVIGSFGSNGLEVWELSDAGVWAAAPATDGGPEARQYHVAAYDPARRRIVVHGGSGGARGVDTWEWDGSTWHQRTQANGPTLQRFGAMVHDSARQRTVLFGGQIASGGQRRELWEWDGTTWLDLTQPEGPGLRQEHAMAFDSVRAKTVLFGGAYDTDREPALWEWGLDGDERPSVTLRFPFAFAAAPGVTVASVAVSVAASGAGWTDGELTTPGVTLWGYDAREAFFVRTSAAGAGPGRVEWASADPAEAARLFVGPRRELGFAVTPRGTNGRTSPATVSVTDAYVTVRYRRP